MVDYSLARKAMVDNQVGVSSVTDRRLLAALNAIPREIFVPEDRWPLAYSDAEHPLGHGRALSAPTAFAKLIQLAGVGPDDRVLDIGCGTGYSAAVLARVGREVVAVEADGELATRAAANLKSLGIANATVHGDVADGAFDIVILEGTIDVVPSRFFAHLAPRGRLVAVLGTGRVGVATTWTRTVYDIVSRAHFDSILPPLPRPPAPVEFVF